MRNSILFIAAGVLSLASCSSETTKEEIVNSSEPTRTSSCLADINQVVDGLKQGIWVTQSSHDTTVYLNDTAYSVIAPMTSGEMLRELKTGMRGPDVDFDSLVLNSH